MSEVPAQYLCSDRIQRLSMVEDDSRVIDQLIERVRLKDRKVAELEAALAAAERRENELINRINELDRIRPGL
jgi:ABC-type phosphate transport system auxiliary subunit